MLRLLTSSLVTALALGTAPAAVAGVMDKPHAQEAVNMIGIQAALLRKAQLLVMYCRAIGFKPGAQDSIIDGVDQQLVAYGFGRADQNRLKNLTTKWVADDVEKFISYKVLLDEPTVCAKGDREIRANSQIGQLLRKVQVN